MTIHRDYSCNLCGDAMYPFGDTCQPHRKPGIGVLFLTNDSIAPKSCWEVERHICLACVRQIKQMYMSDEVLNHHNTEVA